ncbi:MAG: AmmeMemoRadiSam system protein B [Candidatus Magasanikbacteria bacterium CG11_big_fil_rev_8_21_14_0_20_39_34]|uniref:AmmeMemoRadiSam system protein B n=1 Tax=Candidatus Magasanikbacteria bacterium CG11_big_fil_rev_8_21_14_0_20_39_34 TaxID=1974653 RepID=A0A2H0N7Q0_9BACT|nr:MAG: AmmeMemoRadiSam system protein B [Candidatus Magasanikbacteria bacterium CG11_big_fil_rev_8_21_14_0_20_39_34]
MQLVFSGIVPHTPLLIESISKEKKDYLQKSHAAISELEQSLYVSKPDVLIILSLHEGRYDNAFTINTQPEFLATFEQFGDLSTKKIWKGATHLGATIAHSDTPNTLPIQLVSESKLDYGTAVPLILLTQHLQNIKILPIGYSHLSPKEHFDFGSLIRERLAESNKRVAIIASGDLAHTLSPASPLGYHEDGQKFDTSIIEMLQSGNTAGILNLDPAIIENAKGDIYKPLLILLGLLQDMRFNFKNLSYEAPFGIGYLVGQFEF